MRLPDGRVFKDQKLQIKIGQQLFEKLLSREGSDSSEQSRDVTIVVLEHLHAIHEQIDPPKYTPEKIEYSSRVGDIWVSAELSGLMGYWLNQACLEYHLSPGRMIRFAVYEAAHK